MQMKKTRLILLLSMIIVILIACDNGEDKKSTEETETKTEIDRDKEEDNTQGQDNAETKKEEQEVRATYEVNENWFVKPKSGEQEPEDVVLLTIDDAPDEYALEMAEKLHEMNVSAIFFVNGMFLQTEEEKENLRKIDELGFPIGNHTMTHADLTTLSEAEQKEEILGVNELIEEILGKKPAFFRAPYGNNSDYTKELAKEEDMLLMNWVYGYDWDKAYQEKEALSDIMVNTEHLSDGAILLMHDRDWTNEALEDIVTGLQEKGYDMLDPAKIITPNSNQ